MKKFWISCKDKKPAKGTYVIMQQWYMEDICQLARYEGKTWAVPGLNTENPRKIDNFELVERWPITPDDLYVPITSFQVNYILNSKNAFNKFERISQVLHSCRHPEYFEFLNAMM
jgi:hypothetical protein